MMLQPPPTTVCICSAVRSSSPTLRLSMRTSCNKVEHTLLPQPLQVVGISLTNLRKKFLRCKKKFHRMQKIFSRSADRCEAKIERCTVGGIGRDAEHTSDGRNDICRTCRSIETLWLDTSAEEYQRHPAIVIVRRSMLRWCRAEYPVRTRIDCYITATAGLVASANQTESTCIRPMLDG